MFRILGWIVYDMIQRFNCFGYIIDAYKCCTFKISGCGHFHHHLPGPICNPQWDFPYGNRIVLPDPNLIGNKDMSNNMFLLT